MKKIVLVMALGFISSSAMAQTEISSCSVVPSCDKGYVYTEAECEGKAIAKCPFDSSKLWCDDITYKTCEFGDYIYADKKCYKKSPPGNPVGLVIDPVNRFAIYQAFNSASPFFDSSSSYNTAKNNGELEYDNITPIDPHNNTGVVTPPTPVDPYTPITPPTPTPPVTPITPTPQTPVTPEVPTTSSQTTEKKRKTLPFMLVPVIAAVILAKECKPSPVIVKDYEPEKEELVDSTSISSNPNESAYLTYTTEKGKGMLNKQGVENADAVYDNFVNNFDKIPQELKDLVEKYNMGTAKDTNIGIDITDNAQVAATTLILMAESYPNIAPIIHKQMQNPGSEISPSEIGSLNVRCKMAEHAHKKHGGDENGNHLATSDYGLYGASSKTGPSVKFSTQEKTIHYNDVVAGVFEKGKAHNY